MPRRHRLPDSGRDLLADDELPRLGLGTKTAHAMAHQALAGTRGSLEALQGIKCKRKLLTHINNTNPVLQPGSAERRIVTDQGWEVAFDGLEVTL